MEEWRAVPGHPIYEVSDRGNVRRIGGRYRPTGNPKSTTITPNGYVAVGLSGGWALVHRLVCEAFNGPAPTPLHEVAHNDGCRRNNRPDNLRWATRSENNRDQDRHGTRFRPIGERQGRSVLTEAYIPQIIERRRKGMLVREIAEHYGVSRQAISAVLNGYNWKHSTGGACHVNHRKRPTSIAHQQNRAA